MNRLHVLAALSLSLATGCGGPPPAAPVAALASAGATLAAPPPSTSPAVAAGPSAVPEAPARSAFTKVAEVGDAPTLYPMGKRVFVGRRHGATFLEIKGGKIERADAVSPGLDVCKEDTQMRFQQPGELYGDFDKAAFLSRLSYGARTTFITMQRWDGKAWRPTRIPEYSGMLNMLGSFPWRRSTLLLVSYLGRGAELDVLEGPDKAPTFTAAPDASAWQQTRLLASTAVKTRDGELVVAGSDGKLPLVERFSEAGGSGRLEVPPLAPGDTDGWIGALAGVSSNDLYAGGSKGTVPRSYLAHFDGKQWARLETPIPTPITNLALAPDGTLWAVEHGDRGGSGAPGAVWRRRDGVWSRVPASDEKGKPLAIQGLWVLDDGDVWLASGEALYRSRPESAVFAWSDPLCPAISMARPATEICPGQTFVLLYTLGKTTPREYDFPLLRQAIKGHRELLGVKLAETEERGRRYLVGFTGTETIDGLLQGRQLLDLVKKEVKGSTPTLLCGAPRVVRELNIDVMSGEVVKK